MAIARPNAKIAVLVPPIINASATIMATVTYQGDADS
ncbi:unannotated protein [freshwater metagenome]|uniref:Unannotated protein n=1 Tax=freshwater metagenome TaxID=449393 RepID=A0A6J6R0E5_9ZZZZ